MGFLRKRLSSLLMLPAMTGLAASPAMADRIQVNFHDGGEVATSANWNNISVPDMSEAGNTGGLTIADLMDSTGVSTGVTLTIDDENHFKAGGGEPNQHEFTGDAALYFPDDVGGTYGWGQNGAFSSPAEPLTEIFFSGLDENSTYDFTILSWRGTSGGTDRDSYFTVSGATSQSTLFDATNDGSQVRRILGIAPDANNEILLSIMTQNNDENGYYYLNGIVIDVVPEPASLGLLVLGGGLCLLGRRRP